MTDGLRERVEALRKMQQAAFVQGALHFSRDHVGRAWQEIVASIIKTAEERFPLGKPPAGYILAAPAPAREELREEVAWIVCDYQGRDPEEPVPLWALERADRILSLWEPSGLREAARFVFASGKRLLTPEQCAQLTAEEEAAWGIWESALRGGQ